MNQKLIGRDYRFIGICLFICAVSLVIGIRYFSKAFPEASIDFQVTRNSSTPIALEFLEKQGGDLSGYKHNAIFSHDDQAKVFLEREMGLEEANKIMGSHVRLWRWRHRWFKPLQKEEFKVDISPRGELTRFVHLIPEEKEGADLNQEEALPIAQKFLSEEMGISLLSLEFVEVSTEKRPNRTDHTFLWKEKDFEIKDATYRKEVRIQGDKVGGYREFLKVPEKWTRDYEKLRSLNHTTGMGAGLFLFLTLLAMLVVFVNKVRNRDIRWKTAAIFGIIGFILQFISRLNALPIIESTYITTDSYGSFLANQIFLTVLNALQSGLLIFLLTCAAEPLYREYYKRKISLTNLFRWRGIRTKKFILGTILGITLTFFFFGYETIFYLIAQKLGAWAPAEIPYNNLLNSKIPWIFVLTFGFFPAVSEEFISRMFSIPFLSKFLKSTWFAVLISSVIWGFAHANYPNQPFFIRGSEVGIVGIILGVTMVRFGILPTLIAHYTIDALYAAFLMFRSGNPYFVVSAALASGIILIPLIVAIGCYLKTKNFVSDEELFNEIEGTSVIPRIEEKVREVPAVAYHPLTNKRIIMGFIAVALFLSLFFIKVEKFGNFVDYSIAKGEAKEIADKFLHSQGVNIEEYRFVSYQHSHFNRLAAKYVLSERGVNGLNHVFGEKVKTFFWAVRYFKPEEKEEYQVYIDPVAKEVYTYQHLIEEEAEGADLEEEDAREIAEGFLESRGTVLADYELKESSSEKKKARRDHTLVWEMTEESGENIKEAKFRVKVGVQGDEIASFTKYVKLPEEWEREREKRTIVNTVLNGLQISLWVFLILFGLWVFVGQARQGKIRWKTIIRITLILMGIQLLAYLNAYPTLVKNYDTAIALNIYTMTTVMGLAFGLIIIFLFSALAFGLITSLYPDSIHLFNKKNRIQWARDAILSALLMVGGSWGLLQLRHFLIERFPKVVLISSLPLPEYIETPLPFLASFSSVLLKTIAFLASVGLIIFLIRNFIKKPIYLVILTLLTLAAFGSGGAKTIGEFLFGFIYLSISLGLFFLFIKFFLRDNLLAYALSGFLWIGTHTAYSLFSQSAAGIKINGAILFGILILPLLWLTYTVFFNPERG